VVLSACETGLGREVAGEGLISGLPRAFLAAGSRRVLVSLWPVGDRESRELMTAFYRGLAERKLAPARALQEAQAELRRQGRPPYAWAGFLLLGDFSFFDLGS
jgi:CHAT domain-containing protein